jgi:CBS domain-containing protein
MGSKLVGIVTNRDLDFIDDHSKGVVEVMTKSHDIITALDSLSLQEANALLKTCKKTKLVRCCTPCFSSHLTSLYRVTRLPRAQTQTKQTIK